jgi:hypothetical protein
MDSDPTGSFDAVGNYLDFGVERQNASGQTAVLDGNRRSFEKMRGVAIVRSGCV